MRHFTCFVVFTFVLMIGVASFMPAYAQGKQTVAKEAILVDYDTGMILFEKNADEKMPTSSMSKVMTSYAIFDALKDGQMRLDDKIKISEKAWKKGGSKMFIEVGKEVSIEDLLRGVIIQSGNDATIALAEGLSGSEDSFADHITKRAHDLGMSNSQFKNASGWPDLDHYSTARDLATLAVALIRDHPEYYKYFAETEFTFNNIKQDNRNPLLYREIGADGIKTGHTEAGGYGLMGSAMRDGRRVIMVINGLESSKARAQEGAKLLDWGLKAFENVTLFHRGDIIAEASVVLGQHKSVPLITEQDIMITIPSAVRNDLKVELKYDGPLKAPVKEGQQVGTLHIDIPRVTSFEVPVITGAAIAEKGFFSATFSKLGMRLTGTN